MSSITHWLTIQNLNYVIAQDFTLCNLWFRGPHKAPNLNAFHMNKSRILYFEQIEYDSF